VLLRVEFDLVYVSCFQMYLSNMDFENLLGTNRADFLRLPSWRQGAMKKKAGLF